MKTGQEKGLSIQDCINMMEGEVAHYYRAGKDLYYKGYYRRGRCRRPIEGHPMHVDIYYIDDNNEVKSLCYDTTAHRAFQLLRALEKGILDKIDANVIGNYKTNGYSTRKGLFAEYSEEELDRMSGITRSHADYLGNETGSSSVDHANRVAMRS